MRHFRLVATFVLLALLAVAAPAAAAPEGQMTWGVHVSLAPIVVRSRRDPGDHHAVHGHVRAPRRAGQGDAREPDRAEPGGVVAGLARRPRLRLHAPQGREVPQRRHAHLRGREVLVRALQGGRRQGHQGPRRRRGDAGAAAGAVPAEEPVARLHDVLHGGERRGLDRAEEVRREGGGRRVQEGARGRRARTSSSRSRRASSWSWRPSTATGARRRA